MKGAQYPVDTLAQMALIPEDRFSAFLEELPDMVAMLRRLSGANEELRAAGVAQVIPKGLTWCDDGEKHRSITAHPVDATGNSLGEPVVYTDHADFQ